MKIAIVGPTHPYKGGIAQHTTELANRLIDDGHEVTIVSWRHQYPFFYPGEQFVPDNKPELPIPRDIRRVLSWRNPVGWWQWGKQLRGYDKVILIWWVPTIQGPVYKLILKALGSRARTSIICHNVLPHEERAGDRKLTKTVFDSTDEVITHTKAQAAVAQSLTDTLVKICALPATVPPVQKKPSEFKLKKNLLFWGIVRPYKGVDVLLRALAKAPGIKLTIAGEFWEEDAYLAIIDELRLHKRVEIKRGYVPFEELPDLFENCDASVLPYRDGTATHNVVIAHHFGRPVIATTAGSLATQVNNGVDGILCEPDNVEALVKAIKQFYKPGVAKRLASNLPANEIDRGWRNYIETLLDEQ
jgi:glycosyltransferase involved in cell wall biosynthesis